MTAAQAKPRRKKPAFMMRVVKGALAPADGYTETMLRDRNYKFGDIVSITISKCRNPKFNRLAHRIGGLCAANIDDFSGMGAHEVLKTLQIEAKIACDEVLAHMEIMGQRIKVKQYIPRSLSFDSMEEGEFRIIVRAFCRHIAEQYWPDLSPERIEQMAESFVDE